VDVNSEQRREVLWHAMGVGPLWRARAGAAALPSDPVAADAPLSRQDCAPAEAQPADGLRSATIAHMGWDELEAAVAGCTACGLCKTRTNTVFGVGHRQAQWMLIGEAPGAEEDARGEPFVGQAGKLLDNMLAAVGQSRAGDAAQAVYIANVLKCRPPGNRNPEPDEVALCQPYLQRQVALVQPRVIVVMGRFAAQALLGTDATIASLRGRVHEVRIEGRAIPVIVTYHPAYLLRNLADKAKSWADLCLARGVLQKSLAAPGPLA
jgi:DNA polymerase